MHLFHLLDHHLCHRLGRNHRRLENEPKAVSNCGRKLVLGAHATSRPGTQGVIITSITSPAAATSPRSSSEWASSSATSPARRIAISHL